MSKLYISARADISKSTLTKRGNRYIDIGLYYDEGDRNKMINVRLDRPDTGEHKDKIVLWVDGKAIKVLESPYKGNG